MPSSDQNDFKDLAERRSRARRMAWGLAAVALVIFVMFFLSGVFGRGTAG